MRWSHLLLLAVLLIVPGCFIFGSSQPPLPAAMPPNFFIGIRMLENPDPPVDYQIMIERSGEVEYETTIRAPRRRTFQGTLELTESQVLRLYEAVQQANFANLPLEVSAEAGASNRRENGERIIYVIAGDVDRSFKVAYADHESMDIIQDRSGFDNKGGYAAMWKPLDLVIERRGGDGEVEVQLTEKKNKLFGKIEGSWR